jgi:hypothetical protein
MHKALAEYHDGSTGPEGEARTNWNSSLLADDPDKDQWVAGRKLQRAVTSLLQDDGDDILFYFSGHGFIDEDGGLLLAASDDDPKGTRTGYHLPDLIRAIASSRARSATIILDCCHSGELDKISLPANTCVISAARGDQPAGEREGSGLFTKLLLEGLTGGAADVLGHITVLSLYAFAAGALSSRMDGQEPVLKGYLKRTEPLQRVEGKVSIEDLKDIPLKFHRAGETHKVTKDHEATATQTEAALASWADQDFRTRPDPWPENVRPTPPQEEFDYFNRLLKAGLLQHSPEETSLFWTCMHEGSVGLTVLGEYYRQLAGQEGKLREKY